MIDERAKSDAHHLMQRHRLSQTIQTSSSLKIRACRSSRATSELCWRSSIQCLGHKRGGGDLPLLPYEKTMLRAECYVALRCVARNTGTQIISHHTENFRLLYPGVFFGTLRNHSHFTASGTRRDCERAPDEWRTFVRIRQRGPFCGSLEDLVGDHAVAQVDRSEKEAGEKAHHRQVGPKSRDHQWRPLCPSTHPMRPK